LKIEIVEKDYLMKIWTRIRCLFSDSRYRWRPSEI